VTTVAVVVPTFRRPEPLARCLAALAAQTRPPDELVVVTSPGDADTDAVVAGSTARVTVVRCTAPGVLAAMAAGAAAATAEVVAFTDDDAEAPPTWLEQLLAVLAASPLVGAAGGRDVVEHPDGTFEDTPRTSDVGRLTWYGRHVGAHHLGQGPARDVAFLKGVNAAYRRHALGLPHGLRGEGAQVHFEVAMGRFARARGYRLVYDPAIEVAHRPAPRQGEDQRGAPSPRAVSDASYNLVVAIGGLRGACRVLYATALGDRGSPGVLYALAAALRGDLGAVRRARSAIAGTLAGGWALVRGRGVTYSTVSSRSAGDATSTSAS
jgi:GT2 family glycosyltransferase